jgi:hypothetical protein
MTDVGAMIMRTEIAVWAALSLFATLALADETVVDTVNESVNETAGRYVPARFANGIDAAAAEIQFPKYKKDLSLNINCGAKIGATGEVESYFCLDYYGRTDNKFRKIAEEFIRTTSITPAAVDGVPVPVHFHFRVFFGRKGDQYAVGVFSNWADDVDSYGQEYEAPQRYNEDASGPNCYSVGGISKVAVDVDGAVAGDVDLVMSYGVPEHYGTCENWFAKSVADGRYIPAFHEGRPVAATYVEVGGDPEWFTLRTPEGL